MPDMTALDFDRLRAQRAEHPGAVREAYAARTRRPVLRGDGRLFIIAADHPARGALGVGDRPDAMADRYGLLERLAIALNDPGVDGVLGTPDILDDLALLGLLDDKVLVGSMNRGGLRGSSFEMDDRFTAFDVPSMTTAGIDFAKVLLRIDLDDPGTVRTMEQTARVISEAASVDLPIMIEPFMSRRIDGRVVNDLSTDAAVLSVSIAAGVGGSSACTWMKLPVVPDMERVMAATTLPTLLLGGDAGDDQDETYASWEDALALPGVRGLTVGRTLLFPPDDDVAAAVATAAGLVHNDR
ncbi:MULTISPECIES: deoxyribose-phosphate aldolase [unclassified Microbacterium]|uniref:Cgl0159 family (beta/alpha)8-fold protein n=1 Tax=unclassified Microbacterium TaxID=2609290 RepID=UPI0012FAC88E|nr:deoxyribose-phosphate aldolase [Microbacterium sp. MAH-37]MVQ42843.1 deoxyribose-phosphate aldolase [Microbacterium sp. MAH-37]